MRLRLTVQRHVLPPVQLLWTAGHILPAPYAAAGSSITISQFVEQVNDIIPLESDDWGLEDYVVELRGFECLHFSELGQVLKEDDEVCIRPLQSSDLRIRRISGRHQISADGKHLIDGVAFGRPFLRKADRPAIRIPPRKRRRLTYDEQEGLDEQEITDGRQIVLRADFDDADEATAGDESNDDEDFVPDDEDNEELHAELKELQDSNSIDENDGDNIAVQGIGRKRSRASLSGRSLKGLGILALLDENGRPFNGQYENPLLDRYNQDGHSPLNAALRVRKRGSAKHTQENRDHVCRGVQEPSTNSASISKRSSTGNNRNIRFEDEETETPATVREFEDSNKADNVDFEPVEINESDKENAEPRDDETDMSDVAFDCSSSSSSASSEPQLSGSEETSSSGTSSSDSTSGSEPEQRTSKPTDEISDSSQTSSSGSSSLDSDSESDAQPAKERNVGAPRGGNTKPGEQKAFLKQQWALGNVTTKSISQKAVSTPSTISKDVRPGEGAKKTRMRNQRRRESKKLAYLKGKGLLPADATRAEAAKLLEGNQHETDKLEATEQQQAQNSKGSIEFEARRQALLVSIASGGIDVTTAKNEEGTAPEVTQTMGHAQGEEDAMKSEAPITNETTHKETVNDALASSNIAEDREGYQVLLKATTDTPISELEANPKGTTASTSEPRRAKLDLSSTKRMLFGSLGLRTPKTKDDESKVREKLMKDSKPMKNPRLDEETEPVDDVEAAAADVSWKAKIDLGAVECCHEGISLSTPPFPFVQRWDPQQQGGYSHSSSKKRKQKKRKRNNNDYFEEGAYQSSQSKAPRHSTFDTTSYGHAQTRGNDEDNLQSTEPEQEALYDENFENSLRVNEQLQREIQDISERGPAEAEDEQDLPTLPKDPSLCSLLTREGATVGTVIAFKQFEMSANTNWQPRISDYRTAIVREVLDEGSLLMELAKRDQPGKETQYDDQTGERIYHKFEMPGYDEEDDESDNRKITIPFDELIVPILVPVPAQVNDNNQSQGDQIAESSVSLQGDMNYQNNDISFQAEDQDAAQKIANNQNSNQRTEGGISSASQGGSNETLTLRGKYHSVSQQRISLDGATEDMGAQAIPGEDARQEFSKMITGTSQQSSTSPGLALRIDVDVNEDDAVSAEEDKAPTGPPSPRCHSFTSSPFKSAVDVASSPLRDDIHVAEPAHHPDFKIADSVPLSDFPHSEAPSMVSDTKSILEYPDLPRLGNDSDLFHEEAQHRSDHHDTSHNFSSQDLFPINGMDQSPAQSTHSQTCHSQELYSQELNSPNISKTLSPISSDDEFPPLFSQAFEARLSQVPEIKSEFSSQQNSISPPTKRKSKPNSKSKPNGTHSSSFRESNQDWRPNGEHFGLDGEEDDDSTPRPSQQASQPPRGAEIVDMTISSDPPHTIYEDDDDDSFVLPRGPGWVKKARSSVPRNGPTKANSGRRKTAGR